MENLNLVNTKYAIEMLRNHGVSNGSTLGFHAGWCDIAADQLEAALALIKELTEENERLIVTLKMNDAPFPEGLQIVHDFCEKGKRKAEADIVRKMQERLKAQKFTHKNFGELVYVEDIYQIAKEMIGEGNEKETKGL